jgi:hypothetical protein
LTAAFALAICACATSACAAAALCAWARLAAVRHLGVVAPQGALGRGGVDGGARRCGLRREQIGLGREHRGARRVEVGLHLAQPLLEGLGVELRDQLAGLHLRVEVGVQLLDLARDLRAHLYLRHRRDGARGRHRGLQRAALDLRRAVLQRLGVAAQRPPRADAGGAEPEGEHGADPVFGLHGADSRQRPSRRRRGPATSPVFTR